MACYLFLLSHERARASVRVYLSKVVVVTVAVAVAVDFIFVVYRQNSLFSSFSDPVSQPPRVFFSPLFTLSISHHWKWFSSFCKTLLCAGTRAFHLCIHLSSFMLYAITFIIIDSIGNGYNAIDWKSGWQKRNIFENDFFLLCSKSMKAFVNKRTHWLHRIVFELSLASWTSVCKKAHENWRINLIIRWFIAFEHSNKTAAAATITTHAAHSISRSGIWNDGNDALIKILTVLMANSSY